MPEAKRARRHLAPPAPGPGLEPTREEAEFLVHYAALAPSGGNAQPWRFVVQGRDVHCHVDDARATSHLDFQRRGSHVAIGAAVENLVHAARALGLDTSVRPFPNEDDEPRWVATVRIMARVDPRRTSFFEHIPRRVTNRRRGAPAPLAAAELDALREAAAESEICVVQERSVMQEIAEILGEGDRIRLLSQTMHPELMREIRWTPDEVGNTRDGLDLASLELTPTDATALRMLTPKTAEFLRRIDGGRNLGRMARDAIAGSSALLLLTKAGDGPNAYFEGGRCLARLWTQATSLGISVQPWSALCYLFPRLASGEGLEPNEAAALRELHTRWRQLLPRTEPSIEVLFMRLSKAPEASAVSLRLPVTTILDFRNTLR